MVSELYFWKYWRFINYTYLERGVIVVVIGDAQLSFISSTFAVFDLCLLV